MHMEAIKNKWSTASQLLCIAGNFWEHFLKVRES